MSQLYSYTYEPNIWTNVVLIESIHLENSDSQYFLYEKLRHTFSLHCADVETTVIGTPVTARCGGDCFVYSHEIDLFGKVGRID